jgi:hypothetical protein
MTSMSEPEVRKEKLMISQNRNPRKRERVWILKTWILLDSESDGTLKDNWAGRNIPKRSTICAQNKTRNLTARVQRLRLGVLSARQRKKDQLSIS